MIDRGQHLEEQRIGARVLAHLAVDEHGVTARRAHRRGMDFEPLARGDREQFQQARRFRPEEVILRDRNAPTVKNEAAKPLGSASDGRQREAEPLLSQLLVKLGKEHSSEIANRLCVQEIELHEPLDRRFPWPVGVVHDLGDARLIFEAQPLLGAAGEQMQVAAHRPEEALRAVEAAELGGGEKPGLHQVGRFLDAMDVLADPVERVEVAQPALAVLDVGLDDVAAVAHLHMALVALRELGGDELGGGSGHDVLPESRDGGIEDLLVPPQPAGLEERGPDCHVLLRECNQLRG
jgi:hypothetical protein